MEVKSNLFRFNVVNKLEHYLLHNNKTHFPMGVAKMWKHQNQLVMGREQNLRELSVNVISLFTICTKSELYEWQFSPCFVILSEKSLKLRETSMNGISQSKT